jgi:hypothetical protein
MLFGQKQRFESFLRVQDFLEQNPLPQAPANFAVQKKELDDAIVALGSFSGDQTGGQKESRADTVRQVALRRVVRDDHMAPISKIGRALLPKDPGLQKALKLPADNIAVLRLVADALAMRESAGKYEQIFLDNGRPADFLAQLGAVTEELRQTVLRRGRNVGRHVGAKAGLTKQLTFAREAVDLLDTMVTSAFKGNAELLAKWRLAKRVKDLPGAPVKAAAVPTVEAAAPVKTAA